MVSSKLTIFVSSKLTIFGLFGLLLFFGCASQPQQYAEQQGKPVKIENLSLSDGTASRPTLQPILPPDESRALLIVDYTSGSRDSEILLPGQQANLSTGAKAILNYITPGNPDYAKLVINDQVYTIFAGQKEFAGLRGLFDILEKPSKLSARIQVLDVQGWVVQEYNDLKVGSTVSIGGSSYLVADIIYGKSTKQKFITLYKEGNYFRFLAGKTLFNDATIIIDVASAEDKPTSTLNQELILPTPVSSSKKERAYVIVSYPDGASQLVVLPQGEVTRLKDGKVFRVERLDVDYTLAANQMLASIQGETANLRIGEIKQLSGLSVRFVDILSSADFKATFEVQEKNGKANKFTVRKGGKFSFDGAECKLDDIYAGLTFSVVSVQFSCQAAAYLLSAGGSMEGNTQLLRLISVDIER
ncbi:MAG: hypothetical protein QXT25_02415 [Candidatus Anstonellaceae archaeon]